jgi:hypothetical protein
MLDRLAKEGGIRGNPEDCLAVNLPVWMYFRRMHQNHPIEQNWLFYSPPIRFIIMGEKR